MLVGRKRMLENASFQDELDMALKDLKKAKEIFAKVNYVGKRNEHQRATCCMSIHQNNEFLFICISSNCSLPVLRTV